MGAYVLAATLASGAAGASLATAKMAPSDRQKHKVLTRFWGSVALFLLVLAINKQLDLQSLFTQLGRDLAEQQGWYAERRNIQFLFIVAVGTMGVLGTLSLAVLLRSVLRNVLGAVAGIGWLVTFIIVRASSFHHVDHLLGVGALKLNWLLELGGIALIAVSATHFLRRELGTA